MRLVLSLIKLSTLLQLDKGILVPAKTVAANENTYACPTEAKNEKNNVTIVPASLAAI